MPNWKKVIVSGSDAILNSVTASSGILSSGDIYAPNFVGTASYATISKRVVLTNNDSTDGLLYIPFSDDNGNLYKSPTTFRFNPFKNRFNISNISAGSITASADISASGNLYANLTEDSSNYNTVVYNTATGQFFYTGSYGGNASITIDNDANDRIITAKGNGTLNAEQNLSFNGTTLSLNGGILQTTDLGRSFISLKEGDYYLLQAGDIQNARNQTLFEVRDASSSFYFHTQNEHPHYLNSASLFISGTISGSGLYIDNYKTSTATFTGFVDAQQVSASIIKTDALRVSNLTANNGSFLGDLTVEGDIIAQNYIVSSSVTYMTQSFSSGSTIFGDTLDDTHQFTGSVNITGSLISEQETDKFVIENGTFKYYDSTGDHYLYLGQSSTHNVAFKSNTLGEIINLSLSSNVLNLKQPTGIGTPSSISSFERLVIKSSGTLPERHSFRITDSSNNTFFKVSDNSKIIIGSNGIPTASLDIFGDLRVSTNITASGNISASGAIITNELTASGLNYPTTDGDNGDVLITDGAGNLSFTRTTVYANVKNVSGGELLKGYPVHVTGTAGNTSEVIAASASNAATMPAHFILNETLADEAEGLAIAVGYINGVNTIGFTEGDTVYVAADGGYTNVKPTGSNLIQNLGIVDKVDATNGSGFILGAGRSNDVPNIPAGYTWVGNSDGVPTPVPTSSIIAATSSAADRIFVNNANFDSYANIVTIDPSTESNGYKLLQRDDSGLAYNAAQNTLKVGHLSASALTVTESFNITGKQYSTASYHLIEVPAGQMYTQGVFFVTGSMPSDQASPDWTKFSLFKFSTSSALDLDLIINVIPDETEPVSSSILRSTSNIAAITQYPIEVSYEAWPFESGQYTFTIGAGFPLEQSFEGWIFANGVNFSGAIEQYQATNQFNPTGYPYVGDEEDTPQIAGGQSPIILSIVTGSAGIPSGYVSLRLLLSSNTSTNAFLSYIENAKLNVTCVYKLVNYA